MSAKKFISKENLLYVWQKMKLKLTDKVDKVEGKGLSTNDFTDELKTKLLNAGDSSFSGNYDDLTNKPDLTGYANKIESIKVNGTTQEITDKSIDITVATKVSDLTNDSGFQTASDVNTIVQNVVGTAPEALDTLKEIADALGNDENFASTMTAELAKKVNSDDLVPITNEEIDEIFAS